MQFLKRLLKGIPGPPKIYSWLLKGLVGFVVIVSLGWAGLFVYTIYQKINSPDQEKKVLPEGSTKLTTWGMQEILDWASPGTLYEPGMHITQIGTDTTTVNGRKVKIPVFRAKNFTIGSIDIAQIKEINFYFLNEEWVETRYKELQGKDEEWIGTKVKETEGVGGKVAVTTPLTDAEMTADQEKESEKEFRPVEKSIGEKYGYIIKRTNPVDLIVEEDIEEIKGFVEYISQGRKKYEAEFTEEYITDKTRELGVTTRAKTIEKLKNAKKENYLLRGAFTPKKEPNGVIVFTMIHPISKVLDSNQITVEVRVDYNSLNKERVLNLKYDREIELEILGILEYAIDPENGRWDMHITPKAIH